MLNRHTTQHCNGPRRSPLPRLSAPSVQGGQVVQLRESRSWLRAEKTAMRAAFGYRSGGASLKEIASALCVNDAKASRVLSDAYPDWISDDVHLARLEAFGFAHVAAAVRAVRLGLPLAGEGRRAA